MKQLTRCSLFATMASSLVSQSPSVETLGDFGVFTWHAGFNDVRYLPGGTPITAPIVVSAAISGGGYAANARTSLDVSSSGNTTTLTMREHGDGTGFAGHSYSLIGTTDNAVPPTPQPHELRLRLPPTLSGWRVSLRFEGAPPANTFGFSGSFSVDIGNDGSIEWTRQPNGQIHTATFVAGPAVRDVRLSSVLRMSGGPFTVETYDATATVSLQPVEESCSFATYASGCGPMFTETDTLLADRHVFQVSVSNAFPNAPVVFVSGIQQLHLQLPGSTCFLELDPLIFVPIVADAGGNAQLRYEVFGPLAGTSLLQVIPIDFVGMRLASSDALLADCGR
jgi:hypothetical protein